MDQETIQRGIETIDPVAGETSLVEREQVTFDVLVKYLWNPWWALYVGYNSNRAVQEIDADPGPPLNLTDRGEQFFVKFSYLFQL